MILRILLFFTYVILVTSNPAFPVLPSQTYPIYQQNGYTNPQVNLPSNNVPYIQNTMIQNQSPSMNLSPSNVRQILLNRILSSPSLQSILGSNLREFGSNLVDFPQNQIAQSSANNYYQVPTALQNFGDRTSDANTEGIADIEVNKSNKSKRKSSKSRRKHDKNIRNKNYSSKNVRRKDKNSENIEHITETNKKTKKRSRKPKKSEASSQNVTSNKKKDNNETKSKKRKNKENEKSNTDSTDTNITTEKSKQKRRRKKKPKDEVLLENIPSEQPVAPNVALKEIKEGINVAQFSEGILEENRVTRNSKHEGNDLQKVIPLPENNGINFMKTLSQFDNNPFMNNFFANYENIYQSMLTNKMGINEKKDKVRGVRRKKTRKQHRKRTGNIKNRNSTEEVSAPANYNTFKVNPKINIVTTEKTIIIKEKTRTNFDQISKEKDLKSIDKSSEMKETVLKEDGNNENSQQEIDEDINTDPNTHNTEYYGYIDDYYPMFTDSAAYNANNKEVYVKNIGDTKYYYAIDKANPDFVNRRRFEHFTFPERMTKDYEINKRYEDIEKESLKNDLNTEIEEEIKFQSPPHLESPDFETRKINKNEIKPEPFYDFEENYNVNQRFVGDKSPHFDDKSYNKPKHNSVELKDKKPKDIETVFARSKVVKYGPIITLEEDNSSADINNSQDISDETYFKEKDTTYVVAKSLDNPELIW